MGSVHEREGGRGSQQVIVLSWILFVVKTSIVWPITQSISSMASPNLPRMLELQNLSSAKSGVWTWDNGKYNNHGCLFVVASSMNFVASSTYRWDKVVRSTGASIAVSLSIKAKTGLRVSSQGVAPISTE